MKTSFLAIVALAAGGLAVCPTGQAQALNPSSYVRSNQACSGGQSSQTLYVATHDKINVYSLGATNPRLIITGGLAGVTQIAIDRAGKRYASNFGTPNTYADSSVTEYARGHTLPTLTRTDGAFSASGVAVDAKGDVFASSYYRKTVSIYRPGKVTPFLRFDKGIVSPGLLAVTNTSLYVGEAGSAQILQFPSGPTLNLKAPGTLPMGAITFGGPFVVASEGWVYAGGAVVAGDLGFEEFVNVFAQGETSPRSSAVVSTGRAAQSAPYVAVAGDDLYASASDINSVFQYEVGRELTLVRTITTGLNQPGPIALDASRCLYAGNIDGTVTVYPPGATTPSQTITLPDRGSPVAIVIGR